MIHEPDPATTPAFRPAPLLRHPHANTMLGVKLPRFLGAFRRAAEQRVIAVDATTRVRVEANWREAGAPLVVLLHGLSGSARVHYVVGAAARLWQAGFSTLRLNLRSCGGTEALTDSLYHAALTEDLEAAVAWAAAERAPSWTGLVGYSLGGSITLHAAARWGEAPPAGVSRLWIQSAPFDLHATSRSLHSGGWNRIYVQYFLRDFRAAWRRRTRLDPERFPADGMRGIRSVRDFDERWTAPSFGWRDADHYYDEASALRVLDRVRLPGVVLHAADDPFVPLGAEADAALRRHPSLALWRTERGGHVGFCGVRGAAAGGGRDPDRYWAEHRLAADFAAAARAAGALD